MIKRFVALALLAVAAPAAASPPPFPAKSVSITARNASVDQVLVDLFTQSGLRVKTSSAVAGKLNGSWTGPPAEIWRRLSRAYNLIAYWDGAVVRVYGGGEVSTRSFASQDPHRVVREAQRLRIVDANNAVQAGSGAVSASGTPAFLERVQQIAATTAAPMNSAVAFVGTTGPAPAMQPTNAGFVSPLLPGGGGGGLGARETVRFDVLQQAGRSYPYEVRIFYLNYVQADAVAAALRGLMGDGRLTNRVSTQATTGSGASRLGPVAGENGMVVDPQLLPNYAAPPQVVVQQAPNDPNGPRVEVHTANNAVIVRDRPEKMNIYAGIIRSLDVEQESVEIAATILELNVDRLRELGINFNLQDNGLGLLFGGASQAPTPNFSPANAAASYVTGALNGFSLRITALEKTGALRVVSRPRLTTTSNTPATYNDQSQFFIKVPGVRTAELFQVNAGMVMEINPSVMHEAGMLRTRLQINIADGNFQGYSDAGVPIVRQSAIATTAIVRQGESLLLGGMTSDRQFDYKSKTPILGDVPVLGQAFRQRSRGAQHIERLFLITPRVLSQTGGRPAVLPPTQAIPLEQLQSLDKRGRRR